MWPYLLIVLVALVIPFRYHHETPEGVTNIHNCVGQCNKYRDNPELNLRGNIHECRECPFKYGRYSR